jgi:dipeptidyl aminopeptidase/acylaminoacyl peptidase
MDMKRPTYRMPFSLSADGQLLAFSVTTLGRGESRLGFDEEFDEWGVPVEGVAGSQLVVVDTESGETLHPFAEARTSWGGQWSPDGSQLVACVQQEGMACLGVWERASGESTLFPHAQVHTYYSFEVPCWTPDGQGLVVKLLPEDYVRLPPVVKEGVQVQHYNPLGTEEESNRPSWDSERGDLALVDISSGQVRHLARNWSVRRYRVSPDGKHMATLGMNPDDEKKELVVISLADGQARSLVKGIGQAYANAFNWSPDSRSLAYISDGRLFVVPCDGAEAPRDISGAEEFRVHWPDVSVHSAPRWSSDGQTVYALSRDQLWICAADGSTQRRISGESIGRWLRLWVQPAEGNELVTFTGQTLLMTTLQPGTLYGGLALLNLDSGEVEMLEEYPRHCSHTSMWMEVDQKAGYGYLVMEGAAEPAALWRFDRQDKTPQIFYAPNQRKVDFGTCRLLEWDFLYGGRGEGALVLPPDYKESDGPLPTVVVHGDLDDEHSFGYDAYDVGNPHLFAGRGYAVLYIDVPMSDGDPMKVQPGQVAPIVRQMVAEGITDPARVGAYGISYSAYSVMSMLVQSDLYRTAVCASGLYNLTAQYGRITYWGWSEYGEDELGGSLWERRSDHVENSPFFYLDRVNAPLLLISGSGDANITAQAEDVFRAMRRLGKKVAWRSYPDEPHFSVEWSRPHLRDMCDAVLDWFDEHL